MTQTVSAAVSYFGKVPSRGDFVRTADNHQLMGLLDRWAGSSIELLSQNPDWKRLYDQAPDVHYAFMGSRSRLVVCGHFLPSRDASQRRFPLLSAIRLEVGSPLGFIGRSPMALSRVWNGLSRQARSAVDADEAAAALQELAESRYDLSIDPTAYAAPFADFMDLQTIGSLERLLRDSGHADVVLRRTLPALGLLLQPVLTGSGVTIDKGLELPLPRDPLYRPLVGAFWLDIVAAFVARGDFELAVLVRDEDAPRMIVGFNGADQQILRAVLDPQAAAEHLIRVDDAEWVDDHLPGDYALNKLASYVDRHDLSLKAARAIFGETFLGA
ncbi:type VI secretion system-associated protein TagF [Luteimonas sp. SJ-92]|uniref:Type VI secretion system-associated protein TagF n=1 Tax=Luteimonas salinisoli TaxID=2752307 RepID=A0A853JJ00_9GAMM|nr:type VI secretion system-associated protein TagF [Luteimonas salinisoli]NZA28507.1 type VI secretion system-associated protein TagF [Luteimonas salinisoli]